MENSNVDKRRVSRSGRSGSKANSVAPSGPAVKTPAIFLIEWLDAEHEFGWQEGNDIEQNDELLNCFTVGWILKETKTQVKVCQTFSAENHAQTLTIPKGMIVSQTELQPKMERYASTKS